MVSWPPRSAKKLFRGAIWGLGTLHSDILDENEQRHLESSRMQVYAFTWRHLVSKWPSVPTKFPFPTFWIAYSSACQCKILTDLGGSGPAPGAESFARILAQLCTFLCHLNNSLIFINIIITSSKSSKAASATVQTVPKQHYPRRRLKFPFGSANIVTGTVVAAIYRAPTVLSAIISNHCRTQLSGWLTF